MALGGGIVSGKGGAVPLAFLLEVGMMGDWCPSSGLGGTGDNTAGADVFGGHGVGPTGLVGVPRLDSGSALTGDTDLGQREPSLRK